MRMTLDIDDNLLRSAQALADAEKRPLDDVVSDLIRHGLVGLTDENSFVGRRLVTSELVAAIQEEIDMEDVRKAISR